jgi:invasion protein IalB
MQMILRRSQTSERQEVQAEFIVPIAAYLPRGIQFATEKDNWLQVPYRRCSPSACVASFIVDGVLLKRLKSGSKVDVRFYMSENEPVNVAIDLKGFTAAFQKLEQQQTRRQVP